MKHILKIGLSALLLIAVQGCSSHANYPVTHRVGWVMKKNINWEVLELSAKFKHQKFNLFNTESHIIIKAKIKVFRRDENWAYKIRILHIVQRYIDEDDIEKIASIKVRGSAKKIIDKERIERHMKLSKTGKIPFALIEITPIFMPSRDHETKEEFAIFDLCIKEPIQNRNWGRNYYRVKIGNQQIDLGTLQPK